ncbi:MAG TPA: enoyl-CoA hydratase [Gammaproteobacteria bacterium]|nr:enoyl-CoA hydratase [Gammaproteobacteria bacterium]
MTEYTNLRLDKRGHVALVTMANPPANTWTRDGLLALKALIEDLNADREVYSLVLTGEGEKFFSAGADLKLFAEGDAAVAAEMGRRFGEAFETLAGFRGMAIAAINGFAMGGGLEVALACDVRIAETQAKMGLPEAKVGLLPAAGGTQRLPWLVGEGWAKRIILCGEQVDADTALRIGLVEEVVGAGEARDRALALAEMAGNQSPISVAHCKRLIGAARERPMADNLPIERELFVSLFDTQDQREGVNAFLEKRTPQWRNR